MTTTSAPMTDLKLPPELARETSRLATAFQAAVPGAWPDGETFLHARQPAALAAVLLSVVHKHLKQAHLAHVYTRRKSSSGTRVLASTTKVPAKWRWLWGDDAPLFVIDYNHEAWLDLGPEQRLALVDHELCHCDIDDAGNPIVLEEELREFGAVVKRWGAWQPEVSRFIAAARQADLFQS